VYNRKGPKAEVSANEKYFLHKCFFSLSRLKTFLTLNGEKYVFIHFIMTTIMAIMYFSWKIHLYRMIKILNYSLIDI
jgi:hypothetical protein